MLDHYRSRLRESIEKRIEELTGLKALAIIEGEFDDEINAGVRLRENKEFLELIDSVTP